MKRVIAIAITIVVFAAVILPTATVMAYTLYFNESFEGEDLNYTAEGEVWGSYNTNTGYLSVSMRVEPLSWAWRVWAFLHVDLDADGVHDNNEPSVEADNTWWGLEHWLDPLELSYSGIIPKGAIVRYVVQSYDLIWIDAVWAWGTKWCPTAIEGFEWGNDGTSLADWEDYGGDVDWTLTKMGWWWGNSAAEIDTEVAHTGTRSARLYRSGWNYMLAFYSQTPPESRKFYFYFEEGSDAVLHTTNGDGDYRIDVNVRLGGDGDDLLVEYRDGDYLNEYTVYYPTWQDTWHWLEFENIDWVNHTYDIRCDWIPVTGVHMAEYSGPYGTTSYYNNGAMESECWIDDILK